MSFYEFRQNNSGGTFDLDEEDGIAVTVFIEADSAEEANKLAEQSFIYFDGVENGIDCPCCGDRWYEVDEIDREDTPSADKWSEAWAEKRKGNLCALQGRAQVVALVT